MPRKKSLPLDAVEAKREKAVQFLRDVADDPDKAAEFEDMTAEEYAEHKGIDIAENPRSTLVTICMGRRAPNMPEMSKREMESRIAELEEENEDLQSRLESIADIIQPGEEDDEMADDDIVDDDIVEDAIDEVLDEDDDLDGDPDSEQD